nr:GNAT family N-acetyltransferase [Clostridium faecium]
MMTIGTHPEYRNRGYAHMLMQYVIDEMIKDDMHIFIMIIPAKQLISIH